MPTALRDMQPWRRAILEAGMTLVDVAEATGKSIDTVESYSMGRRKAPDDFIAKVLEITRIDEPAEATA